MVRNVNNNTKRVIKKFNINLDMEEEKHIKEQNKDPQTVRSGGGSEISPNETFSF